MYKKIQYNKVNQRKLHKQLQEKYVRKRKENFQEIEGLDALEMD